MKDENKIKTMKSYNNIEPQFDSLDLSNKIINSLPGIFFLYHVTTDGVFLKLWNKKHIIETEYSEKELWNFNAADFFDTNDFDRIKVEIENVFKRGWSEISATLISKTGKLIPYYFQSYALHIKDNNYFMGLGINIAEQIELEKKLKLSEMQRLKEELENKENVSLLNRKKRELLTHVISEAQSLHNSREVKKKIDKLLVKYEGTAFCGDLKDIDSILSQNVSQSKQWELFKLSFVEIHPNFFTNLKNKHPNLTNSELRLCAYLRIQLSNSQILEILNISKDGVRKARYRIRKKLELSKEDSLEDYISRF